MLIDYKIPFKKGTNNIILMQDYILQFHLTIRLLMKA